MEFKFSLLENIKPAKTNKSNLQAENYAKIVRKLAGVYYRYAVEKHGKNKGKLQIKTIEWAIKHQPSYLIARTQTPHSKIAGFLSFHIDEKDETLQIIERWGRPEFGEKEIVKALEKEIFRIAVQKDMKRIGRIGMSINGRKEFAELGNELRKEGHKIEVRKDFMHINPAKRVITRRK